jgi:hypothetical protein
MEYNTQLSNLIIPEFGRHLQKMVELACAIDDREERNKAAKTIVSIMSQIVPQYKESIPEYKQKLWDQLAIISDFKLDVDYPGTPPDKAKIYDKPERISYPQSDITYRHYGKNLEMMLQKVSTMEDTDDKDILIAQIANHMKRSYLTWNRESVTDEFIFEDVKILSKGKLSSETKKLSETKDLIYKPKPNNTNKRKGHR